jgi:drug/metabolite transporter (DMT)-like permease
MIILTYREKTELIFSVMFLCMLLIFLYGFIPSIFTDRLPEYIVNKGYINLVITIILYTCWYFFTKAITNYFVFDS